MGARARQVLVWTFRSATVLAAALVLFLLVATVVIGWSPDGSETYPGGSILRDRTGALLRVALGPGDVDCRPFYHARPDDLIVKALVAVEDGTFWEHAGVRPWSILRAACQNIRSGRRISGASTLTMQAVRLIRPHPKNLWRKFVEAVQAVKMERVRDKCWILSQYLNRAPFGSNLVGIEAAAQGWFGRGAHDLGLGEAAVLAGMVQAPSRYRPDRAMDEALKRSAYVLERMEKLGMITESQRKAAEGVRPRVSRATRPFAWPHYCDWAVKVLRHGEGGADVLTALDPDLQATCARIVASAAAKSCCASAAVVMRVETGEVLALAVSGDYFSASSGQFNTALARRPAGSTLKPLLVALALERGSVSPEEKLLDVPQVYRGYRPVNFDSKCRGLVGLREALVLSLNLPFVQLLGKVGVGTFADCLRTAGFCGLGRDESLGLGLAIGNAEVSLMELVGAYGALARGGVYFPPTPQSHPARSPGVRLFAPSTCYLVSEMLSGDERSASAFGHVADVETPRFAWKTGTSAAYRDAWTVAWNPEYVVGVWCGHLKGGFGDEKIVGLKAAAPALWQIVRALYPAGSGPWFREPEGIVPRRICTLSGLLAGADCPETEEGRALAHMRGARVCPWHVRGADGRVVTRMDAFLEAFEGGRTQSERIRISRPEDGSTYVRIPDMPQQRMICKPSGNVAEGHLWWFVNGRPAGESTGSETFAYEPEPGTNVITCTTAAGVSDTVSVNVE